MSLAQNQAIQCYSCSDPGCCSYLQLHRFWIRQPRDVDYAGSLLNFAGIELGIDARGEWSVFYRRVCRHLSAEDDSCNVHGTDIQPDVCKKYPGDNCWYSRVLPTTTSNEFVRVDRQRLQWYLARIRYNEDGEIIGLPPRSTVVEAMAQLPLDAAAPLREPAHHQADSQCTRSLDFPIPVPHSWEKLDFVKMALGYPGVSVAITDAAWRLVVDVHCSHHDRQYCGRRSVSDPWSPDDAAIVSYEQFGPFLSLVGLDPSGTVISMPDVASIRSHLAAAAG